MTTYKTIPVDTQTYERLGKIAQSLGFGQRGLDGAEVGRSGILVLIAFLIFAIILGLRFRQSLHKHSRQQPAHGLFSNLWLRKEK